MYHYNRVAALLVLALVLSRTAFAQNSSSAPQADPVDAMRQAFYAYDRSLPLNAKLKLLDSNGRRARYHVTYDSAHDQRVTAILSLPKRYAPPFPAVILMHGAGGNKDVEYVRFASEALVGQGIATISLDAQYRGERERPGKTGDLRLDLYQMRDAWVQTVIDLRRAVDLLEARPDIVKSKIGYLGFSMGGMLGSILGGVESRIATFCLAVPGGDIVGLVKELDKYPLLKERWPVKVTPEVLSRVENIANVIDPIYFVGKILPRPLLIIVAKHDEVIPPASSHALVEAAHADEKLNVKRWDAGHALHPNVAYDIRDFFVKHFGKLTPKP